MMSIAALGLGQTAASRAVHNQLTQIMSSESADLVQLAILHVRSGPHTVTGSIIGVVALIVTASGFFTEIEDALNVIWKAPRHESYFYTLLRGRVLSLSLVVGLGILLLAFLVGYPAWVVGSIHFRLSATVPSGNVLRPQEMSALVWLAIWSTEAVVSCHFVCVWPSGLLSMEPERSSTSIRLAGFRSRSKSALRAVARSTATVSRISPRSCSVPATFAHAPKIGRFRRQSEAATA